MENKIMEAETQPVNPLSHPKITYANILMALT